MIKVTFEDSVDQDQTVQNLQLKPLSKGKILVVTELKAFADEKSNVAKMTISLFDRVENTGKKGENAGYQHFLLFPQCLSRAIFIRVVKSWDCVVNAFPNKPWFLHVCSTSLLKTLSEKEQLLLRAILPF